MTHKKIAHGEDDRGRKTLEEVNARRINQLTDIIEKYVRTERHLEQHSDIAELEPLKHALKMQEVREAQIEHLKELIVQGKHGNGSERHNLERNFFYTSRYLDHYTSRMDEFTLEKTMEKQHHRKDQLSFVRGEDFR
jgi:hypothetical protein